MNILFVLGFITIISPSTYGQTTSTTAATTTTPNLGARLFCNSCGLQGAASSAIAGSGTRGKRIIGGGAAIAGQFPWMAAVITVMTDGTVKRCGGTVIKPQWVITSASCVISSSISNIYVSLNDIDLSTTTEMTSYTYIVSRSIRHPYYKNDATSEEHDIALLDLGNTIDFTTPVQPICLGTEADEIADTMVTLAGWGSTTIGGSLSGTLQHVSVPLFSTATCTDLYTRTPKTYTITNNMICTYSVGNDACMEDGGGPVMRKLADGRYVLLGIISFGYGCGTVNAPGVHTRISQYLPWITSITSLDTC